MEEPSLMNDYKIRSAAITAPQLCEFCEDSSYASEVVRVSRVYHGRITRITT